jgi:SAM-dependent methyltransferase
MNEHDIIKSFSQDQFVRPRVDPQLGDEDYLHLSDLLLGLKSIGDLKFDRILDYGCGASPYQKLFQCQNYIRADCVGSSGLDHHYVPDEPLKMADNCFDLVLSTQVLEHIKLPHLYLEDCYRLLKPGGSLILSTHGSYVDHGCPYDYTRWTADGLVDMMSRADFEVVEGYKLTTGPRALIYLLSINTYNLFVSKKSVLGWLFALIRLLLSKYRICIQKDCDKYLSKNRCVEYSDPSHIIYVALLFRVKKRH